MRRSNQPSTEGLRTCPACGWEWPVDEPTVTGADACDSCGLAFDEFTRRARR